MKSRDGKSQRREGKKKEDQKRESLRRKKIQVWSPLKRRVRSQLGRWEMKNCTPLWREAHFEVKMYKTHQVRTTFGSCDVKKVHAVVARSTCRSQKCKKLLGSEHFWKLRCRKIAPLWREAHFEVKSGKNCGVRSTFGRSDALSRGRRKGLCTLSKVSKTWGFCSIPKTMAGVGHLTRICKHGFRVAGAVQETCWSEMLGGQGADFLREVAFWSIRSSGLLRWFCVTGAALRMTWHHFLVARRSTLDRWSGKIAKRLVRGRQPCTQLSIFEGSLAELSRFWCCQLRQLRKSRSIISFLMLSSSKIEEVSQNCFVFDVEFKNWGSLAELLRFQACR